MRIKKAPGQVLAIRTLEIVGHGSADAALVTIKLYRPLPMERGTSWLCHYEILGIGDEELRYGAGSDPIQAILLTLTNIGAYVYGSDEAKAGKLRWSGDENLGFPVFFPEVITGPSDSILKLFL
jgi:hypothetical protein